MDPPPDQEIGAFKMHNVVDRAGVNVFLESSNLRKTVVIHSFMACFFFLLSYLHSLQAAKKCEPEELNVLNWKSQIRDQHRVFLHISLNLVVFLHTDTATF